VDILYETVHCEVKCNDNIKSVFREVVVEKREMGVMKLKTICNDKSG